MILTQRATPCWEVIDTYGNHGDDEQWPHFGSEQQAADNALELAADDDPDEPRGWHAVQSFDQPCSAVHCDVCDTEFDLTGNGATHLNPACPTEFIEDCDWRIVLADEHHPERHICPSCPRPGECSDCGEMPDDCDCEITARRLDQGVLDFGDAS